MYISAKKYQDGKATGKAYTYECDLDVQTDDLVLAEFGKTKCVLQVCELGVPLEKGITYKKIESVVDENELEEPESEIELRVIESTPAKIEINFGDIKTALTKHLTDYAKLVVTEQNLSLIKGKQKELAGLRVKIDDFRKKQKKEMSAPIVTFEDQCKELISLIETAEVPLKDGIKVFDDQTRLHKKAVAEGIMFQVAQEIKLNPKYTARLDILEKYCNLSAKESDIKLDLMARASVLRIEQDREEELLEIIKSTIEEENKKIKQQLNLSDFDNLIKSNASTTTILQEVRLKANMIYDAENPPVVEETPTVEEMPDETPTTQEEPKVEKVSYPSSPQIEVEKICYAVYRCTGELSKLKKLSAFLKENSISYKVEEQGILE